MNPQSDWQQLLRIALLGTRQSGETVPAVADLPTPEPREEQVLHAAGALGLLRKAGFTAAASTTPLPPAAASETLPTLGPIGQTSLQQLLDAQYPALLPDFLDQVARHGRRVPHRLLPALLGHASTRPELHAPAAAVLGERGAWLARLTPAWRPLLASAATDDASAWETGTPRQRLLYLEALRRRDPAQARELLAAALPQEPAKQQAALLAALATGPSAADAPLLEQYLASKSKEVRQAAAPLLARTPGNALAERLWARTAAYLTLKRPLLGKKQLDVNLPETWNPAWQADGIEPRDGRFGGEKAAWLGQHLSLIPPARWAAHWQLAPADVLALAAESEWAALLLTGWQHALVLHQAADWAAAYLTLQLTHDQVPPLSPDQAAALLGPEALAQLLLTHLPRQPRFSQPEARWESLLSAAPGPWPAALTTKALSTIENTLTVPSSAQRYAFHYRLTQLLRHMASVIPPTQHGLCADALNPMREIDTSLNNAITLLLDTLHFRQQLVQAFSEPPSSDS